LTISFVNLSRQIEPIHDEIEDAVLSVMKSGQYILGEQVEAFEHEFATYCESEYGIGVGSGSDALKLVLEALNISDGDEVIVPTLTFFATIAAVYQVGAIPVFVDTDEYGGIDTDQIESKITDKTKAIIPVHLYGHPVAIDALIDIAKNYNLRVIEDACQAHGATYNGQRVGSFGDAACFSFYPTKNLGAMGDGGMVITDNAEIADTVRSMRNHSRLDSQRFGTTHLNSRLDEIQAAILRVKLQYLDKWNTRRNEIAKRYIAGLFGTEVISPRPETVSAWHLFPICHQQRDALKQTLEYDGIGTGIHYENPCHQQPPVYSQVGRFSYKAFPIAVQICKTVLSLPLYPEMFESEILDVTKAINHYENPVCP